MRCSRHSKKRPTPQTDQCRRLHQLYRHAMFGTTQALIMVSPLHSSIRRSVVQKTYGGYPPHASISSFRPFHFSQACIGNCIRPDDSWLMGKFEKSPTVSNPTGVSGRAQPCCIRSVAADDVVHLIGSRYGTDPSKTEQSFATRHKVSYLIPSAHISVAFTMVRPNVPPPQQGPTVVTSVTRTHDPDVLYEEKYQPCFIWTLILGEL